MYDNENPSYNKNVTVQNVGRKAGEGGVSTPRINSELPYSRQKVAFLNTNYL
jgi:hypothetical protein